MREFLQLKSLIPTAMPTFSDAVFRGPTVAWSSGCAKDFLPLVQAALLTGCRYSELVNLTCADFSRDSSTLTLRQTKGKMEVASLLMLAKYEGRRIVAYSQFDKIVAFERFGVDLSPVYADARLIAVKWLKKLKSTHPKW